MQHSVQYLPHIQTEVSQNTYLLPWNGLKMSDMGYTENKLGVKKKDLGRLGNCARWSTEDC